MGSGHENIQTSLADVIEQVQDTIEAHEKIVNKSVSKTDKIVEKKKRTIVSIPELLEDVAQQADNIVEEHDGQPGAKGYKKVQEHLQYVAEQLQQAVDGHKVPGSVHVVLQDIIRIQEVIKMHKENDGIEQHENVQSSLRKIAQQIHDALKVTKRKVIQNSMIEKGKMN